MADIDIGTVTLIEGGASYGTAVNVGDTVTFTCDTGSGGTQSSLTAQTFCATNPTDTVLDGGVGVITPTNDPGSTYSVNLASGAGKPLVVYTATISGLINAAGPTAPTDISFSPAGTASSSTNVTCTASGGSGGTLEVSQNNSTWVANGSSFAKTRGTNYTFYARRNDGGTTSSSYSEGYTVPYLSPDTAITDPANSSASNATNVPITIAGGSSGTQYFVTNNTNSVVYSSALTSGVAGTWDNTPQGTGAVTYYIYCLRTVATGGSGQRNFQANQDFTHTVTSGNQPPSASASASVSTIAPSGGTVTLTGSATDSDGSVSSVQWIQTSGTAVTISPASATGASISSTFSAPSAATLLTFLLRATDNDSATGDSPSVQVNVTSGGDYGFETFNSSGKKVISFASTVNRFVTSGTTTVTVTTAAGTFSKTVTISGFANDDTWTVLLAEGSNVPPTNSVSYVKLSGSFRIDVEKDAGGTAEDLDFKYTVLRE
jgi:hypothetical protein